MTSRGIRILLLAMRGQFDSVCPKEYYSLLAILKDIGMKVELDKEMLQVLIQAYAAVGTDKALEKVDEIKKAYIKLLDPEHIEESEKLMKSAEKMFAGKDAIMRIGADVGQKLDPYEVNRMLNHA